MWYYISLYDLVYLMSTRSRIFFLFKFGFHICQFSIISSLFIYPGKSGTVQVRFVGIKVLLAEIVLDNKRVTDTERQKTDQGETDS